jgi:hypothetical protein
MAILSIAKHILSMNCSKMFIFFSITLEKKTGLTYKGRIDFDVGRVLIRHSNKMIFEINA